jgi:hypothetical protein
VAASRFARCPAGSSLVTAACRVVGPFRMQQGFAGRLATLMGSLIKKRRKRMRKKKHKKMLKRTRWQRRAAGK